jgi:hypothetical protein
LRELVPVFRMIRVPARAGVFMALGLALLAARALGRLRLRPPAAALVSVLALAETVIAPIPSPRWIQAIDSREAVPPVYRWLAAQPGDFAIAELPMVDHGLAFVRPAHHDSIYMVRSTHHWKRLLNGYAGLEPPQYVQLQEKAKRFPSDEALDAFLERGARYVVVHSRGFGPNHTARIRRMLPAVEQARLRRVAEFENDVVFELVAKAVRN